MEGASRGYLFPLAIKSISLIAIYATYGVLQERIIKGHYSNTKNVVRDGDLLNDTFTSAPFLVVCNRFMSLATGIVLAQIQWAKANYSQLPTSTSTSRRPQQLCGFISEQLSRIRPSSSFLSYAILAGLNNVATLSQYASLSYLSFTTSTLGKTSKMVPVLILGHMWYGKRYKSRQWIGAAIVILGVWSYLISLLRIDMNKKKVEIVEKSNLVGVGCLLAYLFFDGLTSTMQERLFGQTGSGEKTSILMGITPGIIDQMVCMALLNVSHTLTRSQIWVNLFSAVIAFWFLSFAPLDQTVSSIKLVLSSPTLQLHIFMLSATATAGLLVLFHVIATYGALIASLIMTVRQFVSIVCNAAWFGNMTAIPLLGWAGIGFMAAGIWIKMDRRYDEVVQKPEENVAKAAWLSPKTTKTAHSLAWQYGFPLVICPTTFVLLIMAIEFFGQPTPAIVDAIWGTNP
jgi:hypothetical protein